MDLSCDPQRRHRDAFSLIELSIVLVILGLLTGGIMAGKSLIRASELRSVTTEYQRYATAYHAFRDRYFAVPGDMLIATSVWGSLSGNGSNTTCYNTPATGTATCNGNGAGTLNSYHERLRSWQHLTNAGLIEGQYSGLSADNDYTSLDIAAANSPVSRLNGGFWYPTYLDSISGDSSYFDGSYMHALQFGAYNGAGATNSKGVVKAEEAWNIDQKTDDGMPATGKIVPRRAAVCTTSTASSDISATYTLTNTTLGCALLFRQLF